MAAYISIQLFVYAYVIWWLSRGIWRLFFHPLSAFPGPKVAGFTSLYTAYIEVVQKKSVVEVLEALHNAYGDVVRIGPNELHFSNPDVYLEIYNSSNRWDKEKTLYHSFGEDRSSFGFLTYAEAKPRKDILARTFSKQAIRNVEHIVQDKVTGLCESFVRCGERSVDLAYAYRCMSIDVITHLCFGNSVNALKVKDYQAPIVLAMDASVGAFVMFKHSTVFKNAILKCPPNISRVISPATAGLVNLQESLRQQVADLSDNPDQLKKLSHSTTIWNQLLRPELHPDGRVPDRGSLFEESQALMFGGADTTGATLMHGTFEVLHTPRVLEKLKSELNEAWPDLDVVPTHQDLEKLPYLTAVIKESLRMTPNVESPLPRMVPEAGALLGGKYVPGGTIVGISSRFVHRCSDVFQDPLQFNPERWLGSTGKDLDKWLVAFSRGPRSCLGLNLAWAELYLTFAHVFRKFNLEVDPSSPEKLLWRACFLAEYLGPHLKVKARPLQV